MGVRVVLLMFGCCDGIRLPECPLARDPKKKKPTATSDHHMPPQCGGVCVCVCVSVCVCVLFT